MVVKVEHISNRVVFPTPTILDLVPNITQCGSRKCPKTQECSSYIHAMENSVFPIGADVLYPQNPTSHENHNFTIG